MFTARKIWKWFGIVIISIAAIMLVGNVVVKRMIQKKFDSSINQLQPFVEANYKDLHINLLTGSFIIDSLSILYRPDSTKTEYYHKFSLPLTGIKGINYFKLISGKNFSASGIDLNNCNLLLNSRLMESTDTVAKKLLSKIKIPFQNITFAKISLANASIKKTNSKSDLAENVNLTISNVDITNVDSFSFKRDLQFSNIAGELDNVNYSLQGYHNFKISKLSFNSKDSILKIDSLQIHPQLGKLELGNKLGHQADCITATAPSITITGIDFKQLKEDKISADKLTINDANVYVFRDRRLPRQMKDQPMTAEYLKQMPFDIFINNFDLKNATATSEEFPKDGEKTGYIKITGINVAMKPLFNNVNKDHSTLQASVRGNIMSAGVIHADIDLSLSSGVEHVSGAINELQLTALNPSAENLGKFHVESGVLNRLNFTFSVSDKKATGKIVGVYHNLVLDKLKETKDGKLKKASLPSFALKTFIIPKNKDVSMAVQRRTGKIDFERDPTRFITFYYIKALLDGIRNSFSLGFLLPQ
jgi:hypothetical protein